MLYSPNLEYVLHTIENIELELNFTNLNRNSKAICVRKIAIRYFIPNCTALLEFLDNVRI